MPCNPKPKLNLMIDLETLSTEPNAAILSIAAKPFLHSEPRETFYMRLDPLQYDAYSPAYSVCQDTINWWDKQHPAARREVFGGTESILTAMTAFSFYCISLDAQIIPWSKGSDFDLPILANAFDQCNIPIPWKYDDHRCFRTLDKLMSKNWPTEPFKGTKHSALDDAIHQAELAQKYLIELQSRGLIIQ